MTDKDKELLSEQEVWDVLEFAKSASTYYNNYFTPDLVNNAMKDVNMNPLVADQDKIEKALQNPKDSEEELIGFSQYFELIDMIYKRSLYYMGNMLSFDYTYRPITTKAEALSKETYKKDEERLLDFMDKFDVKKEFTTVSRQLMRQETFYSVFRDDGERYTLQELPRKYCKITGRWDYGILFDFDMLWFQQPSVDINMYPDSFKKMYMDYFNNEDYTPSRPTGMRDTSFTYWVQTDPEDGFWAWKFAPEITTQVPYFAPMFSDVALRPLIRNLQKNIYVLQAQQVMIGTIPMLKDNKSGNVKDMLAVSPETMGNFLGLLKQGLDDAIKVSAAPFDNIEKISFDSTEKDILNSYTKSLAATSVSAGRLIYSGDKQTALETELSVAVDEYIMEYLYPHFEAFLEYHINKRTKNYKFKIKLEGTNMPNNRKRRFDQAMALADKGIVLPQKIAASIGMSPRDLEMQVDMALASGFADKLKPLLSSYTMTGDSKEANRPKKDTGDLSDSGMANRDN